MSGKTGFGVVLVLVGILVAFLAVTGRAKAIIAAITGQSPAPAPASGSSSSSASGANATGGQPGMSAAAGGSWDAPAQTLSGQPTTSANVGAIATMPSDVLSAMEYNSLIGTDGVKAVPYAALA